MPRRRWLIAMVGLWLAGAGVAAGVYKLPDLFGPLGHGIRMQVLVGSIGAGVAAYLTVRFLMRYFETRTLMPFAIFCLIEGAACTFGFVLTGHTF